MNDTSTSLIHSDLPSLGAQVPSKKMSGGSESLRLSSDVTLTEKGQSWSVSYSGIIMQISVNDTSTSVIQSFLSPGPKVPSID